MVKKKFLYNFVLNYGSVFKEYEMDEKKEQIISAALMVFSEQGYHNAKITKIAEIAGIGAGSVYLYFKNKEHILEEIFARAWSTIEDNLNRLMNDDSLTPKFKLLKLNDSIIQLVYNNKQLARIILHEYRFWSSGDNKRLAEMVDNSKLMFKKVIKQGIDCGDFRKDLIPTFATTYFIGALWHILSFWAEHFEDYNIEIIKNETQKLLFNGIEN